MARLLRLPEVLAGATEAILLSWHLKAGDAFVAGDALAEIETDKAIVELEAEESGVLGRPIAVGGQKIAVGDAIAVLIAAGESDSDIEAALEGEVAVVAEPEIAAAPAPVPVQAAPALSADRLFVSPLVRRLTRERGIDPAAITGTGPGGRIVRRDLDAWLAATPAATPVTAPTPPTTGGFTDIPHTGMRRAIARRLTESKSTAPHFYLSADLVVDRLLALRAEANASSDIRISVNDLLIKAAATAYAKVPEANVVWTDDALRRYDSVDIAVAVSTDKGLVAPIVRDVGSRSLTELSTAVADLVGRARDGRLHQHELEGGTFSISNLGMYGTQEFSAILNPPQSAILAVGAAREKVVALDGAAIVAKVMTVTISVDHRVIDGALAAQWLSAFSATVENPLMMLV